MSKQLSTKLFQLALNTWAQTAASPNAGAGTPAAIGSLWQEAGTPPGVPTTLFLKSRAADTGWLRQNLTGLNVFNVKDPTYGATGDGVTDDGPAIQAAVNACNAAGGGIVYFPPVNAAGGKFYRLKKPTNGDLGSIMLDNMHNVVFMGDGFASVVEMSDDSLTLAWHAFLIQNGSTHIEFENFQISGAGVTNGSAANNLIQVSGNAADANAGLGFIDVIGMYWGSTPGTRFSISGEDLAHIVQHVDYRYNLGDYASCNHVVDHGLGTVGSGYTDDSMISWSWISGFTSTGVRMSPQAGAGFHHANLSNHADGQALTVNVFAVSGSMYWNVVANGGNLNWGGLNPTTRRTDVRGNVVVATDTGSSIPISGSNIGAGGPFFCVTGNVAAKTNTPGIGCISAAGAAIDAGNIEIADNVCRSAGAAASGTNYITSTNNKQTIISGNVVASESNNAATGVAATIVNPTDSSCLIGNLCIAAGANDMVTGVTAQISGTNNLHNVEIAHNLTFKAQNGVRWNNTGTGLFQDWRGCHGNNCSTSTSATVALPASNVGVTGEGPAGPGSQVVVDGATLIGSAAAPQGSLGTNTTGGQATTLFRKEAGAGVSGGTADWYGIGGYDFTFGALLGSIATANRFFAPGGFGLAVETATEIKLTMPRPGTVRNLRLRCTAGTGGGTNSYFVRKNGVDTTLTAAIANTAVIGTDTTHSFTVAKADLISFRVSKSSGAGTPQANILGTMELV